MNCARLAARINPKVSGWTVGLGPPVLSNEDVLLALALISSAGARLLARVMYAGQDIYRRDLIFCLQLELNSKNRTPRDADGEELFRVCRTGVREYTRVKQCATCRGQEGIPDPERPELIVICPECQGMGPRSWGEATRARSSGMGRKYWANRWASFYADWVFPQLGLYDELFWRGFSHRLRDS
jgi:hypothetical protein